MRVGFIGLGNVGAKLSGSLLRNGFDVMVRDTDKDVAAALMEQGAVWADSGRALAEVCDVIITCLPSPVVSAKVLEEENGVLEGISEGKIWLEMSTTEAEDVQRLGALVEAKGGIAMDSPVSGGCHRASTGNIAIFTGGKREAFEKVLPLLSTMGREIVHTGKLGSASVLKVITNYLAGVQLLSTGEAFMVAKKAGIDLAVAYEAIRVSSGNSFVHETEGQLILNGSYNINFTMDHEVKDVTLFDDLAKSYDVPVELSPVCVSAMEDGLKRYGPRVWSSQVVKRLEDDCGMDLRAPGFPEYLTDHEPEEKGAEVVVTFRASYE
ncbi:NAD(P)-dependent oxidoreductase [Roseovarius aestuarii]|uniref:2-hydroxy-3-oxopropionate reductase n=1 Tax=Roseovarius aestuarii TaxID=475083 RepID=A0A1X7BWP7_9RHOB|nr:NAD(P)-dependent oxidoreductase [Roseovarius aestuarii]SMC13910.1 2-hydroxy-3-oxopropionate reductase [Roseovarius aestuarii]